MSPEPEVTSVGAGEVSVGELAFGEVAVGALPLVEEDLVARLPVAEEVPEPVVPAGEAPDGQEPPGDLEAPGEIPGEIPIGEIAPGEIHAGEIAPGEIPAGEIPAGEIPAGELVPASPVEVLDVVLDLPQVHPVVVLQEVDQPRRLLRFPVGWAEGVALSYALRGIATPRPLTHELFGSVLGRFGVSLEVVRITGLVGRTLFAEAVLVGNGRREDVACRPSDALALALHQRLPVPIVVAESVLAEAGDPAPGDTVAGDTVAGDTVAGDTVAGDTVAGETATPE
ncbi:MAG: bifunctional nuclease family protein, partial [Acidimicrobiales bacterium]